MTIQNVIDRILAYHPSLGGAVTCDGFRCGDPQAECTGIVTTCCASVEVIRRAIALHANLIVCHEPVFYLHYDPTDWLTGKNAVYDEKRALCDEHGIAIWRDHDHIHAHKPDGIRYGFMQEMGWAPYLTGNPDRPDRFRIPETTVRSLALLLIPGEVIDWTTACYARDAGQLGKNKAILALGHINSEELGMKYAANWIRELIGDAVPVRFVPSADLYQTL